MRASKVIDGCGTELVWQQILQKGEAVMEWKNGLTKRDGGVAKAAATLIVFGAILGGVVLTAQAAGQAPTTTPPRAASPSSEVEREAVTRIIRLKHAEVEGVANILNMLLRGSPRQGEQYVIVPDSVRNSLLVRASAERLAEIRELIEEIDCPVDPAAGMVRDPGEVRIFRLEHARAEDVANILSRLLSQLMRKGEQFVIVPDSVRNSLLVRASAERLAEIGELIQETDYRPDPDSVAGADRDLNKVSVFELKYAEADDVASLLEALLRDKTTGLSPAPVNIVADVTRNYVLIRTYERYLSTVETLIVQLDRPARSEEGAENADVTAAINMEGERFILKSKVEKEAVIAMLVPEGTHVKKGDLLVELDTGMLLDKKMEAELHLQDAEAAYISAKEALALVRAEGQMEIEKAQIELDLANQKVALCRKQVTQQDQSRASDLAELEARLSLAKMQLEHARRRANASVLQAQSELQARQASLQLQKAKLERINDQIVKTKIYAPADGMVVHASSVLREREGAPVEPLREGQRVAENQELVYVVHP